MSAMCTNYTPATPPALGGLAVLGGAPLPPQAWPPQTFPGYPAPIVFRGASGTPVCELARFGLVPRWARDARQATELSRRTCNARSETVAEKPSFRSPWREQRYALAPMMDFFEPCWESGRAVRWRFTTAGGMPFAVAALHETWTDPDTGELVRSFSLLTVNADGHPLMGRMHRPGDEKRMLVVLDPADHARWLQASPPEAAELLQRTAPGVLTGEPAPLPSQGPSPQQALAF
jgi:putative SOS response-associated peptidase YedK